MKHWKQGLFGAILCLVISYTWRFYEVTVYGEARPDMFDSTIAVTLSVSLTLNVFIFRVLIKKAKEGSTHE